MPPKRAIKRSVEETGSTQPEPASKSTKTSQGEENDSNANRKDSQDASNSANKDKNDKDDKCPYSEEELNEYLTVCRPFFDKEAENDAKPEEEQLGEDELRKKDEQEECGKNCMCYKKISEFPDWKWIAMRKSTIKISDLHREAFYRDQDSFDCYFYNDFNGYGIQEIIENLLVEFNKEWSKKEQNLKEMWSIISAMGHWLSMSELGSWYMLDDGDRMVQTLGVIGCALITALNSLDRAGKLTPDSEFKDISLVISLFLKFAREMSDPMSYDEEGKQTWDAQAVKLATQKGIAIDALFGIKERVDELDDEVKLPKAGADRFKWKTTFAKLKRNHASSWAPHKSTNKKADLGGELYSIVKMSRKERAEHAFDKKDPLADVADELDKGMMLDRA